MLIHHPRQLRNRKPPEKPVVAAAIQARINEVQARRQAQEQAQKVVAWGNFVLRATALAPTERGDVLSEPQSGGTAIPVEERQFDTAAAPIGPGKILRKRGAVASSATRTLEERLFDKSAALKSLVATYAMHLDPDWRTGLFENLNRLLDPEEWDFDGVDYPDRKSFITFLRMAVFLGRINRPGLGMSERGTIVAVWMDGKDKLSIECMADDKLRWVLATHDNGERESVAGMTQVKKLREILKSFRPERWFG